MGPAIPLLCGADRGGLSRTPAVGAGPGCGSPRVPLAARPAPQPSMWGSLCLQGGHEPGRLDLMILEVFSNLNDSVILWRGVYPFQV